jgi:hypothetical protein
MPANPRAGRIVVAALAAGALAVGAAGCGGGSSSSSSTQPTTTPTTTTPVTVLAGPKVALGKKAYERKMRVLGNQVGKSINGLYPLSSGTKGSSTAKQTVVKLQKAQTVVRGVLVQLKQIAPPAAIAKQHRQLENGVSTLVDQLGRMITDTEAGNVADFVAGSNFTTPLQMINAAADAMNHRGYNIIGKNAQTNP